MSLLKMNIQTCLFMSMALRWFSEKSSTNRQAVTRRRQGSEDREAKAVDPRWPGRTWLGHRSAPVSNRSTHQSSHLMIFRTGRPRRLHDRVHESEVRLVTSVIVTRSVSEDPMDEGRSNAEKQSATSSLTLRVAMLPAIPRQASDAIDLPT